MVGRTQQSFGNSRQWPDDSAEEEDDFLSQMGSIVVFTSSTNSVKNLRAALGDVWLRKLFPTRIFPKG